VQWDEVRSLVDSNGLTEAVGRACERRRETPPVALNVDYVRFKYGTSCLLGLSSGGAVPCDFGYLKVFEAGDARTCARKYAPRAGEHGWVEEIPQLGGVLFRFPLDRTVSSLPSVTEMGRLKHVLHAAVPEWSPATRRVRARKSELRLLRYKPERRGIARADVRLRNEADGTAMRDAIVAQAYGDDRPLLVRRVGDHLGAWTASLGSEAPFRVPRVRGVDAERRILVRDWCEGTDWGDTLGTPAFEEGCRAAARALRRLREAPLPDAVPASTPLAAAEAVLADLTAVDEPIISASARELSHDLPRLLRECGRETPVLVHGDFHYHQFLLDDTGGPHTLIDWDECRVGDPREDAGNLLAHLHLLELDGRLDTAEARRLRSLFREEAAAPADLDPYVALQLVKLSFVPFRNLRPDWREATWRLLERAGTILFSTGARG